MNPGLVAGCAAGGLAVGWAVAGLVDPDRRVAIGWRAGGGLVTGGLFTLAAARLGPVPALAAYCVFFAGLVAVSIADVRAGIVPRRLLYPTLALVVVSLVSASAAERHWTPSLDALIGGVVAFAVFYAVWWVHPKGLGFGDVRLAGVIGVALGWLGFGPLYAGFVVAFLCGTAVGIVLMVRKGTGRKTRMPFAPALAAGAAFGVLWGPWLAHIWLHRGG